nr:phenoloxidase-activating factor 2-like [Drosophila suzukii]XP_016940851.1 phenoloxidase-activating factor 2-like [Drosophila suzukii]
MILLNCLIICACIFTGGAQDRTLDNLIADIFKADETPSSSTTITPVVNPKDPSSNSGTGTDKGTETGTGSAQYQSCGDQKVCVPRRLCANDTINNSGDGIIDIQLGTGSQCKNYLDVCCDLPNKDIVDGQG